jgi:hypothetical protein
LFVIVPGSETPSWHRNQISMSSPAPSPDTLSEPSTAPDARQRAALLLALALILVAGLAVDWTAVTPAI